MNAIDKLTKLADLADLLDTNGEHEAANDVDKFMRAYAEAEGVVIPPKTLENMLENVDEMNTDIEDTINFLKDKGYEVNKLQPEMGPEAETIAASFNAVFEKLASVADTLDKSGSKKGADLIDSFIAKYAYPDVDWKEEGDTEQSKRYDEKYHHNLLVREPKRDQERLDKDREKHHIQQYQERGTHPLQTRYCPNHIGVSMSRVGEGIYQCSLDGHIYDFNAGFTLENGDKIPPSSISNQTEMATPYASPARIFDSRQNIINTIN